MTTSGVARRAGENEGPLRVLIVYHCVAHYRDPVFRELVTAGRREGIEYEIAADIVSSVASIRLLDHESFTRDLGARWTVLRNVWFPAHFLWQRGLMSLLLKNPPAAVVFLGDFHMLSTWMAAVVARLRGTRVFMWSHGYLRRERGLKGYVRLLFYRLADALLVYGRRAKALLEERGYEPERVEVIYNSLDHERQIGIRKSLLASDRRAIRKELLGAGDEKVYVFAGRLEAFKGLDLLFEAFARLPLAHPGAKLVCIGDGPIREDLAALAQRLGVATKVIFWGACYDEEVMGRLFHASDVCVSPGPVGLLAIHSLVYGTPVLMGDDLDRHGPEFEVVTDGRTGGFFRSGSVESLSREMLAIAERLVKPGVSGECFSAVDEHYTPANQARLINGAVRRYCAARLAR